MMKFRFRKMLPLASIVLVMLLLTTACGSEPEPTVVTETTQPTTIATEATTQPETEPTTVPTEPETYDYAVYPDPRSFIDETDDNHHVWTTDTYQYDTIDGVDQITGPMPYYWEQISFQPSLDEQIWAYIAMLEEEPFDLELVYTKDMGDEWVYVYRYTGEYEVYPLNISGFVPKDTGEYHMAVDVCKASRYRGATGFEIAVGYGLECIDPETCQDIMDGKGYQRKTTHMEDFEAENPDQEFICYYCKKTVAPSEDTYMGDEQIIYCDDCYEDMFGE